MNYFICCNFCWTGISIVFVRAECHWSYNVQWTLEYFIISKQCSKLLNKCIKHLKFELLKGNPRIIVFSENEWSSSCCSLFLSGESVLVNSTKEDSAVITSDKRHISSHSSGQMFAEEFHEVKNVGKLANNPNWPSVFLYLVLNRCGIWRTLEKYEMLTLWSRTPLLETIFGGTGGQFRMFLIRDPSWHSSSLVTVEEESQLISSDDISILLVWNNVLPLNKWQLIDSPHREFLRRYH